MAITSSKFALSVKDWACGAIAAVVSALFALIAPNVQQFVTDVITGNPAPHEIIIDWQMIWKFSAGVAFLYLVDRWRSPAKQVKVVE